MRRLSTLLLSGGLLAGLGLGVAAQQKPSQTAAAKPAVTVYKSPT